MDRRAVRKCAVGYVYENYVVIVNLRRKTGQVQLFKSNQCCIHFVDEIIKNYDDVYTYFML